MREIREKVEGSGIAVRFVVIGSPELARTFCSRFGDASLCIADPQKRTFKAMGLENYPLWRLLTDRTLHLRAKENRAAGFRQNWRATRMENAAQLPGAAFFDRDGVVRWLHRGRHPGDLPPMSEMLAAASAIVRLAD